MISCADTQIQYIHMHLHTKRQKTNTMKWALMFGHYCSDGTSFISVTAGSSCPVPPKPVSQLQIQLQAQIQIWMKIQIRTTAHNYNMPTVKVLSPIWPKQDHMPCMYCAGDLFQFLSSLYFHSNQICKKKERGIGSGYSSPNS